MILAILERSQNVPLAERLKLLENASAEAQRIGKAMLGEQDATEAELQAAEELTAWLETTKTG
jgi:hypothetical protein